MLYCPEICDSFFCFPETLAGHNVTKPCPAIYGIIVNAMAYKYCTPNGTWEMRFNIHSAENNENNRHYTHYESCFLPKLKELLDMCENFGPEVCLRIGRVTRYIELMGLTLSLISLILSLYIFFSHSVLKNRRTKIHKNLFFATLFQVFFRLIKYIDQALADNNSNFLLTNYYLPEIFIILMEYSKTAMFTWMFIEGLYLHNVITITVFHEYIHINFFTWCGWIIPALMTAIWIIVMISTRITTTWTYYYFLPYYWILEGPRSAIIFINLLFLLNILRVLIMKLRESKSSEIEQVRKGVRAAIFLLPLMGIAHILFLVDYRRYTASWQFALWSFLTYFFNTFQGFFVAVLYCFLNGEVQLAIKNNYYTRTTMRRSTYNSCRISETSANFSKRKSTFWKFCVQPPESPEEKELEICDIGKRDVPTSTTIMESALIMMNKENPDSSK